MAELVSVLDIEEAEAMGLANIFHAGQLEEDNPAVDYLKANVAMQDRDGRQIISYKQYLELSDIGARLDNYAMRMQWPGSAKVNTIQASKYLKWYGLGYRPPALLEEHARKQRASREYSRDVAVPSSLPEDVTLFFCRDKYSDCKRVFDTQKGLKFHWNKDHGEMAATKPRTPKE